MISRERELLERILTAWEAWAGEDEALDAACGEIYALLDSVLALSEVSA